MNKTIAVLLVFCMQVSLHASDLVNTISLDVARMEKVDRVIENINTIVDEVEHYILDTGDLLFTKNDIINYYSSGDRLWRGYHHAPGISISFDALTKRLRFDHVVGANIEQYLIDYFRNHASLPERAVMDDSNALLVELSDKTARFVDMVQVITAGGGARIAIDSSLAAPALPWFKPDGYGAFEVYLHSGTWERRGTLTPNTITRSIITNSESELNSIPAIRGVEGYVVTTVNVDQYIYDGSAWKRSDFNQTGLTIGYGACNAGNIGSVRYEPTAGNGGCIQFCSATGWKCQGS
jgi:hypothetical protein